MENLRARLDAHLGDTHRVVRELGSGGTASVFLATETKRGREVALKVLRPQVAGAVGAERFLREIDTASKLTHPHILPLHDSGRAGPLLYYSMPFVDGESLRSRIEREGALSVEDAVRIAMECADGLAYAHAHGFVHRDVKPGNILLSADHAVLADFGIARALEEAAGESLTTQGIVVGTVGYMSPEQASGEKGVDERSDIYSLGCVLYEMLTGDPPFAGRTRVAVIARQMAGPPVPLAKMRPEAPKALEKVVARCLARMPADRFQTADELREALSTVGAHLRAGALHTDASRHRSIRRVAIGALAALAVVALVWAVPNLPSGSESLDPGKVVVFPLADRGGGGSEGADVALMIGNALVHTGPLRWIDGWELLSPAEREDPTIVTAESSKWIARDRGAGHYLTGGLARTPDSLIVRLVLHDTQGDSVVGQASASGPVHQASAAQLGLEAVVRLLPSLVDPGRRVDLSPITDRSPAAVALWIQGDRAYRSARFTEALDLYQRAVDLDSLLTLAALKGGLAASWLERPELAADLIELAVAHDSVLPPPHRAFSRGLRAHEAGRADEAVEHYRSALSLRPDWAEAWTALGETYRHLLPHDVVEEQFGRRAFRESVRLDSTFTPALVHLAEAAVVDVELEAARELLTRVQRAGAEPGTVQWVILMEACVSPPRPREVVPAAPVGSLLYASQQLAAGGRHLRCAETGFSNVLARPQLTRAERWSATMGLMSVFTAEDRVAELDSLLERSLVEGEGSTRFLFALAVIAGADLRDRATAIDAEAARIWGPDYTETGSTTLWLLSLWNAWEGDLETARVLTARLDEAADSGDPDAEALATAARAHLLAAEGDSTSALALLRDLHPAFPPGTLDYGLIEPMAPERMLLAELLLARGRAEEAYGTAELFDHPNAMMFVPFVARSLALRVRAAEAMSGADWASRADEARARLEMLGRSELVRPP